MPCSSRRRQVSPALSSSRTHRTESFIPGASLAHLAGRVATLPLRVTKLAAETLTSNRDAMRLDLEEVRMGSIYGMTPDSPFITAIGSIPVTPTVPANSIIAVEGDGPIETGDDGVVKPPQRTY